MRAWRMVAWSVSGVLVLLLLVLGGAYLRGGGPVPTWVSKPLPMFFKPTPPLARSDAPETVLRTLRLAGFRTAGVGEADRVVVVRLDIPEPEVPGDVALSWQAALAAGAEAYPKASRFVAQLYIGHGPALQVSVPAEALRSAIAEDDPELLRTAAEMTYGEYSKWFTKAEGSGVSALSRGPRFVDHIRAGFRGTTAREPVAQIHPDAVALVANDASGFLPLPAGSLVLGRDVTNVQLETKDRAAKLWGSAGAQGGAGDFSDRWARARAESHTWEADVPVPREGVPEAVFWDGLMRSTMAAQTDSAIHKTTLHAAPQPRLARDMYLVARAVGKEDARGSVLKPVAALVGVVREARMSRLNLPPKLGDER